MVYRVLVDCESGDAARTVAAESALEAFDARESHDRAWAVLGRVAAATLREAVGDLEGAALIVRPSARGGVSPLADALVAELLSKAGEPEEALACAWGGWSAAASRTEMRSAGGRGRGIQPWP